MKRLIIMRHAKSSWKDASLSDHQRPLNKRGKRDAPRVARELQARGWAPALVLSSDSARTRLTFEGMQPELVEPAEVRWLPEFYHGGAHILMEVMTDLPEQIGPVLALGHNPGWENAVLALTGESETMTTANAALLEADGSWAELAEPGLWRLVDVLRPKEIGTR